MKRTKKILGIISMIMLLVGTLVTTVSASTAIGDPYAWNGIQVGWWLIILAVLIGGVVLFFVDKELWKKGMIPTVLFAIVGVILVLPIVSTPLAETTSTIAWSITSAVDSSATNQTTTDDDARTITILCKVNSTTETMNNTWDEVGAVGSKSTFVNPVINFTISPSQTEGIVDTDKGVTGLASVNNPDQEFTEDSTTYDLFADASGENKKDVNWTGSGSTEDYESKYYTVNFGNEDYAILTIVFLDDGISQLEAGESESFTITICGITYTATIIVTEVLS